MSSSTGEKKRKAVKDEVYVYTGREDVPRNVTHVRFHPRVVEVDKEVFRDCKSLREVILNDGLREIGSYAFENCKSLQSINNIPSTVIKIGNFAFSGCTELKKVVLNEGLREIGLNAFSGCSSLKKILLNEGLTEIRCMAFINCKALQSITTPSTVEEIDTYAFGFCRNLREVVLKEGVKTIKQQAFHGCTSIERITIPLTVTEMEQYAFLDCNSLREVVIHNEEVQIDAKSSFRGCTSLERFSFPDLYTRLENIIQAGQRDIEAKIDDTQAVVWRGGELSIPAVRREVENRLWRRVDTVVEVDEEKLNKVKRLIAYYEKKEATTIFELALWRSNMYQADITNPVSDREACRIEVPGPVKETVLQFLG